jgi:3D (Asp-Asp-Asp) domain-containing protein
MRLLVTALSVVIVACASPAEDEPAGETESGISNRAFTARGSAYYPDSSALEGGFVDRRGARLRTLQQFLAGRAAYVSVAMDVNAFPYGQQLRIRELNAKYGRDIVFKVVDTGGAFRNKGRTRIDVCVADARAARDATINGTLTLEPVDERDKPDTPDEPADTPEPSVTPEPDVTAARACGSDGACNPGNNGSGMICSAGQCVPGCRLDAHCPGTTRCTTGTCR